MYIFYQITFNMKYSIISILTHFFPEYFLVTLIGSHLNKWLNRLLRVVPSSIGNNPLSKSIYK